MPLSRARGVAFSLITVCSVVLGLGVVAPAEARPGSRSALSAPTVDLRKAEVGLVTIKGRTAKRRAKVRVVRAVQGRWVTVKRTRARNHRYVAPLRFSAGTSATLRVVSGRTARTVQVRLPAKPAPKKPRPSYDACGLQPAKSGGGLWACTFNDEFSGTTLDRTKWIPQTAFATGDAAGMVACYRDHPDNVAVAAGSLRLTVLEEPESLPCGSTTSPYTAGSVTTYNRFSQQYGRFEARMRNTATDVAGLHEAFWLWPDNRYSTVSSRAVSGEIDISETYSVLPNLSIPFLHYSAGAGGSQPGLNTAWNCVAPRGQWNTYTLEWAPSRLEIFVNQQSCLVNTSGDPAFQKPYIVMLTQALGLGNNAATEVTPIPATLEVDYVRVWK